MTGASNSKYFATTPLKTNTRPSPKTVTFASSSDPEPHALVGPIVGLQGQSVDVVEELEVHLVQPLHAEKARVPLVLPR